MPVQTRIQNRRDTAANWTSTNPTLASGEIGVETNTGKFKVGDGSTAWTSLLYAPAGLASTATSLVGGAAGSLPYQSGANTTTMLSVGTSGQVLMVDSATTLPKWVTPKLDAFATTSSEELRSVLSDETGTGFNVFSNSPSLTTPTIGSAGANFSGSTSGTTILKATATASGTLSLPAGTGTLITAETVADTYVADAGGTMSGALVVNSTITSNNTVTGSTLKATGLTTAGIVTNNSSGVLSTVDKVPVANGGTGGNTVETARQGLRIFVQATQPSSPISGDLWFW